MCEKCVRKAKRLGHKPLTYGQVKFFAHRFDKYESIPVINKGVMCSVEGHLYKIQQAKTKRRYSRKNKWDV